MLGPISSVADLISSIFTAAYNIGNNDTPKWVCIDTSGRPFSCERPSQISPEDVEHGNSLLNVGHGVYTNEQRDNRRDDQQHGNRIQEVVSCLTKMVTPERVRCPYALQMSCQ